jgi:hypothetical protein
MSKALRLLFGLCLLPCSTAAYPATNNIAVSGMGAASCAEFLQQVRENPDMENIYFTWAQGLMSGWNTRGLADKRTILNLALITPDQQQAQVREFCETYPDGSYLGAVYDLIQALGADPLNLRGSSKRGGGGSSPKPRLASKPTSHRVAEAVRGRWHRSTSGSIVARSRTRH